jgi:hypothetical protein
MRQKAGSLKKINKIDKPLASLTKMRRENTKITKIRNEKREITTITKEMQEIIRTILRTYIQINWKIWKTNF